LSPPTPFDQDQNVLRALRAGADGFLSKGAGPTELTDAIVSVAAGARALSPSAVSAVVEHVVQQRAVDVDPVVAARFAELTPRERRSSLRSPPGWNDAEIAERFFLSPFTVKTHANRAMTKVGARDCGQLVAMAVRAGIDGR
jgi:DNA-binding NarL/FixJ family response regulator